MFTIITDIYKSKFLKSYKQLNLHGLIGTFINVLTAKKLDTRTNLIHTMYWKRIRGKLNGIQNNVLVKEILNISQYHFQNGLINSH